MTHFDQPLHHLNHFGDVAGGPGLIGWRQAPERLVSASECAFIAHRHHPIWHIIVARVMDDLVVNVGDIADESDVKSSSN
ncbi:unannotated protein [freshwater metagenome]|uniref:Unannotated protein n=1 Tax=freshwater metagenome TaxID=449393 RepID=A0A6J7A7W7_9ZZZZ